MLRRKIPYNEYLELDNEEAYRAYYKQVGRFMVMKEQAVPLGNFLYISDGIQSSGLTTNYPSDAPSAWGFPQ